MSQLGEGLMSTNLVEKVNWVWTERP